VRDPSITRISVPSSVALLKREKTFAHCQQLQLQLFAKMTHMTKMDLDFVMDILNISRRIPAQKREQAAAKLARKLRVPVVMITAANPSQRNAVKFQKESPRIS